MNHNAEAEDYEENAPARDGGFLSRWRKMLGGTEDDPEPEEDREMIPENQTQQMPLSARASGGSYNPLKRGGTTLRIDQARQTRITVRRSVQTFDDARRAADGLKDGQQQIVNLEQTPADMAERITDFLNGATYALDGSVEKIGEMVYLFTPSTVVIDIEDKPATTGVRAAIFDRG